MTYIPYPMAGRNVSMSSFRPEVDIRGADHRSPQNEIEGLGGYQAQTKLAAAALSAEAVVAFSVKVAGEREQKLQDLVQSGLAEWDQHLAVRGLVKEAHETDPNVPEFDPKEGYNRLNDRIRTEGEK